MKKFFLMFAALGVLFTSCQYDDTDIVNRIDNLDQRLTELEETVKNLNNDIAGVQTLVEALNGNVYVSKIVEGESGYEVYFTDGKMITITDGKAGEAGKDGVTVTVMLDEEDGLYYWAITENGVTSFIEVDGKRLPVKGEKGNTPQMRVVMEGETGFWEVSYDNGETWERVLLADGTPVNIGMTSGAWSSGQAYIGLITEPGVDGTVAKPTPAQYDSTGFVIETQIGAPAPSLTIAEGKDAIRFEKNADKSYANKVSIRTMAKIDAATLQAAVGETGNDAVEEKIVAVGFVFAKSSVAFNAADAQTVAKGGSVSGYTKKAVSYIQNDGTNYNYTCLIEVQDADVATADFNTYAYIALDLNGNGQADADEYYFYNAANAISSKTLYNAKNDAAWAQYGWGTPTDK